MVKSFSETMKEYKENQRKKRVRILLGAGICMSIITAVGIIQAQVPKIDKEA